MGCQSSRKDAKNQSSPNKTTNAPSFGFNTDGQIKGNIVIDHVGNVFPTHLAIEQIKTNAPSNYLKGHYNQNSKKVEMPVNLPKGRYKLHVVVNWEKEQEKYTVAFQGNSAINFKESDSSDKHQNFYDCITEECKQKGKSVKNEGANFFQTLYHDPQSNLIIVTAFNRGKQANYNMSLDNSKDQHLYKIINGKSKGDQQWVRSVSIPQKSYYTWIIAPKVPYVQRNIYTWEIKDAILGDSDQCFMMEIGGGFNRPVNPPPDAL